MNNSILGIDIGDAEKNAQKHRKTDILCTIPTCSVSRNVLLYIHQKQIQMGSRDTTSGIRGEIISAKSNLRLGRQSNSMVHHRMHKIPNLLKSQLNMERVVCMCIFCTHF